MNEKKMKVVVIGGVAAGPKVASRLIRMNPNADVTVIEKGALLSYAGCGLPYYVSGVVKEQKELMSTPAGVVRDPVFFRKVKNVHVRNNTRAVEIDRVGKRVAVEPANGEGEREWLSYDKLVLCTGARPVMPLLPGLEKRGVYSLHEVGDAEGIKAVLAEKKAKDVVIVGGGADWCGSDRGSGGARLPRDGRGETRPDPGDARRAHGAAGREAHGGEGRPRADRHGRSGDSGRGGL